MASSFLAHQAKDGAREGPDLLRLLTCGSVDDGKSTLIGRLLYDAQSVLDDQLEAMVHDSKRFGKTGGNLDFALLVDGLLCEREQGITIDVAYRYFRTDRRRFIIADTPGHEEFTRNMVSGASRCDLAVLLVDAQVGLQRQTYRHAYLASMFGIRQLVLAVNKMDLVEFDHGRFIAIQRSLDTFVRTLGFATSTYIPMSARFGDNVVTRSCRTPWYVGPSLLEHLETVGIDDLGSSAAAFRYPVQWINRPDQSFRGYSGTVAGGRVKTGDVLAVARTGERAVVDRIVTFEGDQPEAVAGMSVTLVLGAELDIGRGDILVDPSVQLESADQIAAQVVCLGDLDLLPGRPYVLKIGTRTVGATISQVKHRVDVTNLQHLAAKTLHTNEVGLCNVSLSEPIAFDSYERNRTTGGFILIDRSSNETIGAGLIHGGLSRAHSIPWETFSTDKAARARIKGQQPCVLWFTGLSGAGKSTIADIVERKLLVSGHHTYVLDGDSIRHGLSRDLGFTDVERVENIRRVGEVAALMVDAGLIVLVSLISPFREERLRVRELLRPGEFIEIFVDVPLEIAAVRDPKGLYAKARAGKIRNFTGIDSPYEPPLSPTIHLPTAVNDAETSADQVIAFLQRGAYVARSSA